jgi:hypothetical protein
MEPLQLTRGLSVVRASREQSLSLNPQL